MGGVIKCAKDANILDSNELNGTGNCFITYKHHMEISSITTRLINPAKNQIGRYGKEILDWINSTWSNKLEVSKWKTQVAWSNGWKRLKTSICTSS